MDDLAGLGVPRSFALNYNKELHEKISKSLVNSKMACLKWEKIWMMKKGLLVF